MTNEEKQLLLKDLCARLPYGNTEVKVTEPTNDIMDEVFVGKHICSTIDIEDFILGRFIVKPYLRPMSSITKEEEDELYTAMDWYGEIDENGNVYTKGQEKVYRETFYEYTDWLLSHHFDYRGLIEKGLAIVAPEGMYKEG